MRLTHPEDHRWFKEARGSRDTAVEDRETGTTASEADADSDEDEPDFDFKDHPIRMAATEYGEGDKVTTSDGTKGVVVEVYTEPFDGPDGSEVDATEDEPAYVIGTVDGAQAVSGDDLTDGDWSTDVGAPDKKLAEDVDAAKHGDEERAEAGPTDWDFPESWEESETPNRLILLDAWSSMGGQFDCPSGTCCKGTMMSGGMSDNASDQFCASMKDRVLLWEGWRQGG